MRWLAGVVLVSLATAGCSQLGEPEQSLPAPSDQLRGPLPVDVDAFLVDYHRFVTSHPVRRGNEPSHLAARETIQSVFEAAGLEVWLHDYTNGIEQRNIIGIHWGLDRTNWIVVAAHYDTTHNDCLVSDLLRGVPCVGHLASQGAYDNGSGTALLMDLAKRFAGATTNRTIAFVLFDGEERGLQGSRAWIETMLTNESPYADAEIHGAMIFDMFGLTWPGVDAPIHAYGTASGIQAAVEKARREIGVPDDMVVYGNVGPYAAGDDGSFEDADLSYLAFDSNFGYVGAPTSLNAPRIPGPIPTGAYPFFHIADTWETMTLAAGGDEGLRAGFKTTLQVMSLTLSQIAGIG